MKNIIVFDIDRTLIDSYESEIKSLQEAIEVVLKKKLTNKELMSISSLPTTKFFELLNINSKQIQEINQEWEKTLSKYNTRCFPNIKNVLRNLNQEGYRLSIITSRTKEEVGELGKELQDIKDLIEIIVTANLISRPKPAKDSMEYLLEKLKVNKEQVIYIGDSQVDKAFSINSEVTFIPACWENKELIQEKNACCKPEEIINRIHKINNE